MHAYHVHDGTYRYMVAAKNQREAARLLGCSVGHLRQYGGRCADGSSATTVALSEPGRVWKQKIDYVVPQPWVYAEALSEGRG